MKIVLIIINLGAGPASFSEFPAKFASVEECAQVRSNLEHDAKIRRIPAQYVCASKP